MVLDTETRKEEKMTLCACGCGQEVIQKSKYYISKYIKGHQNKGKHISEEQKKKISESNKGKCKSEETIKKLSESNKGKHPSEETKKKLSKWQRGKHLSEETKKKMSESKKGKLKSKETKNKMSEVQKGKHHTEETKNKMSNVKKGEKSYFWKGGISFLPYCSKFNKQKKEEIRNQYSRKCYICGKDEKYNLTKTNKVRKLSVHHVDNDKEQGCNGKLWKLVPLCMNCHNKIHYKRKN